MQYDKNEDRNADMHDIESEFRRSSGAERR